MHRIDTKTAQKDKFGAGKNGFTRGNPQTGTPATDLDDDYFDMLQEELCSVVEASGASLEKGRHDQLLTALRALLLSRKNPFGDIKSDGTVKTALENLGLGEGSALPIGVPVPWPSATPPTGWLKCNGAPFSAEEYPELAKVYPTNELPDLRGEFIRGWDDGRGVDAERSILTAQEDMIKSHEHSVWRRGDNQIVSQSLNIDDPGRKYLSVVHSDSVIEGRDVDSLYAVPTGGSETRPRNIAFNYIVRAV
ncbi:TPA: tail fiber protein [Salmonella enterica]|nr:phage tail protein [Salmonella enterica subsp. enterica serovar Derby]HCC3357775.1 tail fiber protein [Salmonella enterica]MDR5082044.1 phage tail protein [Salmonella enterica subsp. enterica serovar Derby]MDR5101091.1 phage tail protein [Salmonella enterica subsp. enterica serovar Derby]MDR5110185.1 phage tail protein [Salmonella enterica subsp. enterica serovar Derby]